MDDHTQGKSGNSTGNRAHNGMGTRRLRSSYGRNGRDVSNNQCTDPVQQQTGGITDIPSSEANRETVAAVYDKLGRVRERRPGGFHTLIGGDFNGEVGSRTNGEEQALGPHGHGRCNEKGRMLLDSCQAETLVVTNTWTSQKNKTTWVHP